MLKIERIYSHDQSYSGYRILVDGLWPRGVSKEKAKLDTWEKSVAPSKKLRKWFNHDPEKYADFKEKYVIELDKNPDAVAFVTKVKNQLKEGDVILLFGAKDEQHNQAVVLYDYLIKKLHLKNKIEN